MASAGFSDEEVEGVLKNAKEGTSLKNGKGQMIIRDYDAAVQFVQRALIGTNIASWERNNVARTCLNAVLAYVTMEAEQDPDINVMPNDGNCRHGRPECECQELCENPGCKKCLPDDPRTWNHVT